MPEASTPFTYQQRMDRAMTTPGLGGRGAIQLQDELRKLGPRPETPMDQAHINLYNAQAEAARAQAGGKADTAPSIFTDPNGNQWVRHGNNPLQRSKTEEQIAAELAARSAPRAMAPEGSQEAVLNGVKVLVGPDGRIYKMPATNPLTEILDRAAKAAAEPPTPGGAIANWWNNWGNAAPVTNAPPSAPTGAPVVRWGLDAKGNPVKLP